jgi:hypothetical protein
VFVSLGCWIATIYSTPDILVIPPRLSLIKVKLCYSQTYNLHRHKSFYKATVTRSCSTWNQSRQWQGSGRRVLHSCKDVIPNSFLYRAQMESWIPHSLVWRRRGTSVAHWLENKSDHVSPLQPRFRRLGVIRPIPICLPSLDFIRTSANLSFQTPSQNF